jgi:uncharacterized membrane protein YecN with MAPEG domain
MAAGLCISLVALSVAAWAWQDTRALPLADRLKMTIEADGLVVILLAATIANVARLRFFSEQDIGGSGSAGSASTASASTGSASTGGSDKVRRASAVVQNTLEQAVLAMATHLVVTTSIVHSQALVQTMVGLFAVGRLLFWAGYKRGATGRALGFALTFYPSVIGLVASLATLLLA